LLSWILDVPGGGAAVHAKVDSMRRASGEPMFAFGSRPKAVTPNATLGARAAYAAPANGRADGSFSVAGSRPEPSINESVFKASFVLQAPFDFVFQVLDKAARGLALEGPARAIVHESGLSRGHDLVANLVGRE
jgi:hypothetical protein